MNKQRLLSSSANARFLFLATMALAVVARPGSSAAQQFTDWSAGQPRAPFYAPDPSKVQQVLFWYDSKAPTKLYYKVYSLNGDNVDDAAARRMSANLEAKNPGWRSYSKETNERDVQSVIAREQNRYHWVTVPWVDPPKPRHTAAKPQRSTSEPVHGRQREIGCFNDRHMGLA